MEAIIIGDLVQLKSGGPRMTVKRIVGQGLDTWQGKTNEQVLKYRGIKMVTWCASGLKKIN